MCGNLKVVGYCRLGETMRVVVVRYNALINDDGGLLSQLQSNSNKPRKLKFSIRAAAERNFQKDIGIPLGTDEAKVYLGLKSPFDTDPDIAPDQLK